MLRLSILLAGAIHVHMYFHVQYVWFVLTLKINASFKIIMSVCMSFVLWCWLLHSLISTTVQFGFQQDDYTVCEGAFFLRVCVDITGGSIDPAVFSISTSDIGTATGKAYHATTVG